MKLVVTNKGQARTVDFLAVFDEGETREFTSNEVEQFQTLSGVPVYAGVLSNEEEFDVVILDEKEG